jgi:hypothetical protein
MTNGKIGNGVASPALAFQPTPLKVVGGLSWKSTAAGGYTTCGITTNSRVHCFGDNERGGLGAGATGIRTQLPPRSRAYSPVIPRSW